MGDYKERNDQGAVGGEEESAGAEGDVLLNQPIAFEVPSGIEESLILKHPPKRIQRLEAQLDSSLTQEEIEDKQEKAEKRRIELLNQRVQSAKSRSARSARTKPGTANDLDDLTESIGAAKPDESNDE